MNIYELFENLKLALHLPEDIELRWLPGKGGKYRGMVSKDGKTIFIFDRDEEEAKETLVHECIELLIVKLAQLIVNPEIAREEKELYEIKEAVVETIRRLITEEEIAKKGFTELVVKELKKIDRSWVE